MRLRNSNRLYQWGSLKTDKVLDGNVIRLRMWDVPQCYQTKKSSTGLEIMSAEKKNQWNK